ncbi:MAG TPA: ATP-binding protein [Solirubrobacteraceae bacterium]|nr:ATP-binding protein [Solirubrobacteraceae bacterium]
MGLARRLTKLARRLPLPRRTIRLRLALLYGGLFFISGAALLAIIFTAVASTHGAYSHALPAPLEQSESHAARSSSPVLGLIPAPEKRVERTLHEPSGAVAVHVFDAGQHGADVRVLALVSVIALLAMAAISMGLGWLVAGRVLRPLRTITRAAREISATDLHRRLALGGPDDEFKELGDTFDGLLARLDASFQAQRRFVANASHELRTPLARLKTLAQVALADPHASVDSLRAAHERVLASEQQLEDLIDALLSLARGERGVRDREPVDLASLTAQVLASRRDDIERRGLRLHAALGPARTDGSPQLLERLVANLIDNAIRHNAAGGRIDVATTTAAPAAGTDTAATAGGTGTDTAAEVAAGTAAAATAEAVLSVANDGPPIAQEELERLRAPFQRLGAARVGDGEGHGLGLSIVHAIATAHDARLDVSPRPEGGLAVEVRFRAGA